MINYFHRMNLNIFTETNSREIRTNLSRALCESCFDTAFRSCPLIKYHKNSIIIIEQYECVKRVCIRI